MSNTSPSPITKPQLDELMQKLAVLIDNVTDPMGVHFALFVFRPGATGPHTTDIEEVSDIEEPIVRAYVGDWLMAKELKGRVG